MKLASCPVCVDIFKPYVRCRCVNMAVLHRSCSGTYGTRRVFLYGTMQYVPVCSHRMKALTQCYAVEIKPSCCALRVKIAWCRLTALNRLTFWFLFVPPLMRRWFMRVGVLPLLRLCFLVAVSHWRGSICGAFAKATDTVSRQVRAHAYSHANMQLSLYSREIRI